MVNSSVKEQFNAISGNSSILSDPKERAILQTGYTTMLKQYDIPDDRKARMRLLANLIIDRYLKDKAEGRLKTFD